MDLFQSCDLIERKNIVAVTMTIYALGRAVSYCIKESIYTLKCCVKWIHNNALFCFKTYLHPEYKGPHLGPKPAEENHRNFSEAILKAGENTIGLQAGSNKGASQAGQNFGATRKILLGK